MNLEGASFYLPTIAVIKLDLIFEEYFETPYLNKITLLFPGDNALKYKNFCNSNA